MTRITSIVACTGLLCLGVGRHASADPVRLTAGSIVTNGQAAVGPVSIIGTRGFSLIGQVDTGEGRVDPYGECTPCGPGRTTISVGAFLLGTALPGVATLDGKTYTVGSGVNDDVGPLLEFFGTALVPEPRDSPTVVTAPFTAEGRFFLGFDQIPVLMEGRGIATLLFNPFPAGIGSPPTSIIERVRYDFTDETPVPEPATLTMVAGGLIAIARARKRRRPRAHHVPRPA